MEKIFIVTSGSYSDYDIEQVFSTRELAEEYIDRVSTYEEFHIEEFEVDGPLPKRKKEVWEVYLALYDKHCISCCGANALKRDVVQYGDRGKFEFLIFYVEADGRERAIKIASERFGAVIEAEAAKYPLLRTKPYPCSNYHPMYNFFTGDIVLISPAEWVTECYPPFAKIEIRNYTKTEE